VYGIFTFLKFCVINYTVSGKSNPSTMYDRNSKFKCILTKLHEAAWACVQQPDSWRRSAEVAPGWRAATFPPGVHRWSDQAVASTSSSLCSSTWRTFWLNADFSYVWCLHPRTHWPSCLRDCYSRHVKFWSNVTQPFITNADVGQSLLKMWFVCN